MLSAGQLSEWLYQLAREGRFAKCKSKMCRKTAASIDAFSSIGYRQITVCYFYSFLRLRCN